jgi:hypothetical protein
MNIEQTLIADLKKVTDHYNQNELAYLALTSKIELPVRDKWAFLLHESLWPEFVVTKEWRRTDIAVLQNVIPECLIELKAMYSFDALNGRSLEEYIQKMNADEKKAQETSSNNATIYTVLLATHPKSLVPENLKTAIAYSWYINGAFKRYLTQENILTICQKNVDEKLINKNVVARGALHGGEAFGISTDVLYWIVRK